MGHFHQRLDAAEAQLRVEQVLLVGPLSCAEQLALRGEEERRKFRSPAIALERRCPPALQFEGMTELEMDVGVAWGLRQRCPVRRLSLPQPPGILQHVAVLDADVGASRRERDHSAVGFRSAGIVVRVPQAVRFTDMGFAGLLVRQLCQRALDSGLHDFGGWNTAVGQQSLGVSVGGDRLLLSPGQLQQMRQLEVDVAILGRLRQRLTVGCFRLLVASQLLEHVAELHADICAAGVERQRSAIKSRRPCVCTAVTGLIASPSEPPRPTPVIHQIVEKPHIDLPRNLGGRPM